MEWKSMNGAQVKREENCQAPLVESMDRMLKIDESCDYVHYDPITAERKGAFLREQISKVLQILILARGRGFLTYGLCKK